MRSVITAVLALAIQASAGPTPEPPLSQILVRAGEQVRRFEQDFARVISDEDYRQHADGRSYLGRLHRRTHAEMLFLWLPDEAVWLTVRNVLRVDGQKVAGSENRLRDALDAPAAQRLTRLRGLVNESARFNVGRAFRNFNYPTLVLSYLDPAMQSRFSFTLVGRERVRGTAAWKVNYAERTRPTVIQGDGRDAVSRGAVWIAERDGVLVRTRLDVQIPRVGSSARGTVDVYYERDGRLDMWVPVEMQETYLEMRGSAVFDNIGGEATYSNFRRFETSGRLL